MATAMESSQDLGGELKPKNVSHAAEDVKYRRLVKGMNCQGYCDKCKKWVVHDPQAMHSNNRRDYSNGKFDIGSMAVEFKCIVCGESFDIKKILFKAGVRFNVQATYRAKDTKVWRTLDGSKWNSCPAGDSYYTWDEAEAILYQYTSLIITVEDV